MIQRMLAGTIAALMVVVLTGCPKPTPTPVPVPPPIPNPNPTPIPTPPVPPDGPAPDPFDNEKSIPFNITIDKVKTDLIGRNLVIDRNTRWVFNQNDQMTLTITNQQQVNSRNVVLTLRVTAINSRNPNQTLDGTVRASYEMIDGRWMMFDVSLQGTLKMVGGR